MQKALSVNEINQLSAHNVGLQEQNKRLQKDLNEALKALELLIIDSWVELRCKEPTKDQIKADAKDYLNQAKEALKG